MNADEGVRGDTTLEGLSKLKSAFKDGGSTTAGNSSQLSDGAAAVLVTRRYEEKANAKKLVLTFKRYLGRMLRSSAYPSLVCSGALPRWVWTPL